MFFKSSQAITWTEELIAPAMERVEERIGDFVTMLPLIVLAIAIMGVFAVAARFISNWQTPFRWLSKSALVQGILQQMVATAIGVLGILVALELLQATALVGAVLGAAGLLGVALGFAFRDVAENYLSSILLGLRRPFAANDHVLINNEHEGKVMRLTTRETVLMTLEGNHLRLPNAMVYKAVILNYTRNPLRLFQFEVGVDTASDLVNVQTVGIEALLATPGVSSDPRPFSRVEKLGDWSVVVRFFAWVDQQLADWYKVRSEGLRRVKVAFDDADVMMPIPMQQIDFRRLQMPRSVAEGVPESPRKDSEAQAHDVGRDFVLEKQMANDQAVDAEPNLLAEGAP